MLPEAGGEQRRPSQATRGSVRSTVDLGTVIVEPDRGSSRERLGGEQKRQYLETCLSRSFIIKGSRELEECAVE